jgi:signal transduction histidine kinase
MFDAVCPVPGGMAVHPDCYRLVLDRTTIETVSNYLEKVKENRKKAGIDKAASSLKKLLGEVKKIK